MANYTQPPGFSEHQVLNFERRLATVETREQMLDETLKKLDTSVNCLRECAVEYKIALRHQREEHTRERGEHLEEVKETKALAAQAAKDYSELKERLQWWEDKKKLFLAAVSAIALLLPILSSILIEYVKRHMM